MYTMRYTVCTVQTALHCWNSSMHANQPLQPLHLSPYIRYLVAILRFDAINTLFWRIWAFMVAKVFLGQEVHYNMVFIAYFTELSLQICDYEQKRRI